MNTNKRYDYFGHWTKGSHCFCFVDSFDQQHWLTFLEFSGKHAQREQQQQQRGGPCPRLPVFRSALRPQPLAPWPAPPAYPLPINKSLHIFFCYSPFGPKTLEYSTATRPAFVSKIRALFAFSSPFLLPPPATVACRNPFRDKAVYRINRRNEKLWITSSAQ